MKRSRALVRLILFLFQVRAAAAVAIQRILEGAPQRAFLAIAEQEEPNKHPARCCLAAINRADQAVEYDLSKSLKNEI